MGKRANQGGAKVAAKKTKVDPALALVMDTVKKANHLPEQCRVMLSSMLPFSLAPASEERGEAQQKVVNMVEETLQTLNKDIASQVSAEEGKLEESKNSMAELVAAVTAAEAQLAEQTASTEAAQAALSEATEAKGNSFTVLEAKKLEHKTSSDNLASMQKEKSDLEEAFQAHFLAPMENGSGPSYKELKPFLAKMNLEASLYNTLPGACAKSSEDRGSFDTVILQQLEQAIRGKISSLTESVTAETQVVAQHEAAVAEAQQDHESKFAVQFAATEASTKATQEKASCEKVLSQSNEAVSAFRLELEAITQSVELVKEKLAGFESGPLNNFNTFKARTASAEAAPLGA
jgi:septal ring factor EnvC (AmiA/AmiB activator)